MNLPVFETYQDGSDTYELAGLSRGGQQMQVCPDHIYTFVISNSSFSMATSFLNPFTLVGFSRQVRGRHISNPFIFILIAETYNFVAPLPFIIHMTLSIGKQINLPSWLCVPESLFGASWGRMTSFRRKRRYSEQFYPSLGSRDHRHKPRN